MGQATEDVFKRRVRGDRHTHALPTVLSNGVLNAAIMQVYHKDCNDKSESFQSDTPTLFLSKPQLR